MLLLIPGPVTTNAAVRAAMASDYAPWDEAFRVRFAGIIARIGQLAGADPQTHSVLPLQGSGHFVVEAALRGLVPAGGTILIPTTGAYARRMARLARDAGRNVVELAVSQIEPLDPAQVAAALAANPAASHVGLVQSETSSGVIHDPAAIGAAVRAAGRRLIVDAISAFPVLPLDLAQPEIDAVLLTANKCLEAMPGITFAITRTDRLVAARAGSWSLDLADLHTHYLRRPGYARFTPSPQAIAALDVALDLLGREGGPVARLARYTANLRTLYDGIIALGLTPFLGRDVQGPIVMNVHAPADPAWHLQRFVDALKDEGFLISNFYDTATPSFRVGCIGAITPDDMHRAVAAIGLALKRLGIARRRAA